MASGESVTSGDTVGIIPPDEQARLAAVRRYDILDTPPDGAFDRVASLASRFFDVPIATVTIVDEDRIWFKAHHGIEVAEIPRDPGLCASAILQDAPYVVSNAADDPRTLNNPLVRGDLGLRFYAAAPIVTRDGYKLGTVNVIDSKPREVAEQDLNTLSDLASVVLDEMELRLSATRTITLERERADAENREKNRLGRVAKTLQQILLPASLPEVPGAEIATFYRPGSTDDIGGDFYDVFPLTGNRWAATVGDVAGKGVEAAALTSLARYTMRGAAIQTHDPGDVLSAINETVALDQRNAVPPKHCTAVFAVCEIDSGGAYITLANGGHPPAILLTAEGGVDIVPAGGPILGWMPDAKYPTASVRLRPGDTLLLYTDGITDARNDGERFGEGAFARALADRTDNAPKAVVAEIKSLLDKFDSPPSDDIAVLAIGVPTR